MPDFKSHYIVNTLLLLAIGIYGLQNNYFNIVEFGLFYVGFIIGTDYLTPDLDTVSTPYNKSKLIWFPYRKLSKHRGLSHTVVGIFIRLAYISLIVFLIALLTRQTDILINFLVNVKILYYALFLGGIIISNVIHIVLDKMF